MNMPKESLLSITQKWDRFECWKANCEIWIDPIYGAFLKYSDDKFRSEITKEVIPDLLSLVPCFTPKFYPRKDSMFVLDSEDVQNVELTLEIDHELIVKFINKWGIVGQISNLWNIASNDISLQLENRYSIASIVTNAYQNRNLIPMHYIQDELVRLARCVRLVIALSRAFEHRDNLNLNSIENKKRIVSAWGLTKLQIPDDRDPAKYRPQNESWVEIVDFWGKSLRCLDWSEIAINEFATKMNSYLLPATKNVIWVGDRSRFIDNFHGLETAIAQYLVSQLSVRNVPKICIKCKSIYFSEREKKDLKYCSNSCGQSERQKKYRQKQKEAKIGEKRNNKAR